MKPKVYKPDDIRTLVTFPLYTIFVILGVLLLKTEFLRDEKRILVVLFLVTGVIYFGIMVYGQIFLTLYTKVTEEFLIVKNSLMIPIGKMKYTEIDEMIVDTNDVVTFKNINGKKILVALTFKEVEEFLNTLVSKAINCRKIDFTFIKDQYPNISVYERDV